MIFNKNTGKRHSSDHTISAYMYVSRFSEKCLTRRKYKKNVFIIDMTKTSFENILYEVLLYTR